MMTLIDEDGEPSETKYLAHKNGLSGGWRGFAIDHELVDGDALVCQLISPTEFKVIPLLRPFISISYCHRIICFGFTWDNGYMVALFSIRCI